MPSDFLTRAFAGTVTLRRCPTAHDLALELSAEIEDASNLSRRREPGIRMVLDGGAVLCVRLQTLHNADGVAEFSGVIAGGQYDGRRIRGRRNSLTMDIDQGALMIEQPSPEEAFPNTSGTAPGAVG